MNGSIFMSDVGNVGMFRFGRELLLLLDDDDDGVIDR